MSAQSVTTIPSQPSCSLHHSVRYSWLECTGTPLIDAELAINVRAPALKHSRNGRKNFSLRSPGAMMAGVLSFPVAGTPYPR